MPPHRDSTKKSSAFCKRAVCHDLGFRQPAFDSLLRATTMQRLRHRSASPRPRRRCGAVLVETALVTPVFGLFLVGIMEFGHAYLVVGSLNAAARAGARIGAVDGATTADIQTEVERILGSAFKPNTATILVKDASVFDESDVDAEGIDYSGLPSVEVANLEAGQLFIVRVEVAYNEVALLPPFYAKDLTLKSQSVMRHE
jgi:hypothetical protein